MTTPQYIRARVHPKSRKEALERIGSDLWDVRVKEPAERGAANRRVRALLALEHGVRPDNIILVKGATSPSKTFLLTNHTHV